MATCPFLPILDHLFALDARQGDHDIGIALPDPGLPLPSLPSEGRGLCVQATHFQQLPECQCHGQDTNDPCRPGDCTTCYESQNPGSEEEPYTKHDSHPVCHHCAWPGECPQRHSDESNAGDPCVQSARRIEPGC